MNKTKKNKRKAGSKKSSALKKITRQVKKKIEPCPICLERIPKKLRAQTVCGHYFHRKCINEWCLQKARENKDCICPVCRENLKDMTNLAQKKLKKSNTQVTTRRNRYIVPQSLIDANNDYIEARRQADQARRSLEQTRREAYELLRRLEGQRQIRDLENDFSDILL